MNSFEVPFQCINLKTLCNINFPDRNEFGRRMAMQVNIRTTLVKRETKYLFTKQTCAYKECFHVLWSLVYYRKIAWRRTVLWHSRRIQFRSKINIKMSFIYLLTHNTEIRIFSIISFMRSKQKHGSRFLRNCT